MTSRQKQIADYIDTFWSVHWTSPNVRQIGEATGMKSKSAVHNQLMLMVKAGILERHVADRYRVLYRVIR